MARKKVNLAYIQNDATRRATFKKRKKGLIKKAHELSTLCGVDTCVVIYGPQDPKPEVWASPNKDVLQVLAQFKKMPQLDQCKKMIDQEGFLRMQVTKERERLCRVERDNKELETKLLMHDVIAGHRCLSDLTIEDMTGLICVMEMRLKAVQERLNHRSGLGLPQNVNSEMMIVQEAPHVMPMAPVVPSIEEKMPVDAEVRSWLNPADGLSYGCTEEMTTTMMPWCVEGASAWDSHIRS